MADLSEQKTRAKIDFHYYFSIIQDEQVTFCR